MSIFKKLIEKIFYSQLFRDIRALHYKGAHDQGKFNAETESWLKSLESRDHKTLFRFNGDDFEVVEIRKYDTKFYHISVEGYMGLDGLGSSIELYKRFLHSFKEYLEANYDKPQDTEAWKEVLYKTRAIEIHHEYGCYWVFLDGYESTEIWELYDYMKDVIDQLEGYVESKVSV